jgi:hypothetical protein
MLMQMLPDAALSTAWERLGTVGILVVAAIFAVRYLVHQLEKKDESLAATIQQFIAMTKEFGDLTRESHQVQHETAEALKELRATFTTLDRRDPPTARWDGRTERRRPHT